MKNFDRPNVLVAGGAGFIGANICESLLGEYNVVCVDDYSFGHESAIDELLGSPHFEFIRHDIREPFDFSSHSAIEKFRVAHVGFQHIVHAAGAGSALAMLRDPIGSDRTLSEGTRQLLELAVSSHAKLYLLSDALVYGAGLVGEITEEQAGVPDENVLVKRAAEAKRFAESLVRTYADQYSLETAIIRLGVVYGPRMFLGDGRLISTMVEHALHKENIRLPEALGKTQALYVSDMCDAVKKLFSKEGGGTYNLSSATVYPLSTIVDAINHDIGGHAELSAGVDHADSAAFWLAQARLLSIHAIKESGEWFPVVRLEDGLHHTIEFLKSLRSVRRIDTH